MAFAAAPHVLKSIAISGSLRKASTNSGLIRAGANTSNPSNFSFSCFSVNCKMEATAPRILKFIAISGSLRKASTNTGLIRAASEIVQEDFPDVELEVLETGHLPFVNTDLEEGNRFPESVTEFRRKVADADAVIFACPEYNYSVPGVLKNAVDWASRPPNVWADKPAALMSSGGGSGGSRAQYHLRQTGVFLDLHFINKPEVFVKAFEAPAKFDKLGNLVHEPTRARVKLLVAALRAFTLRLNPSLLPNDSS